MRKKYQKQISKMRCEKNIKKEIRRGKSSYALQDLHFDCRWNRREQVSIYNVICRCILISVILYRIKNRTSIFYPDRSHFHYRLADNGFTHKKTVYVIYEIFVVTAGISYFDFNLLISLALLLLVNPILLCLIFLEKEN